MFDGIEATAKRQRRENDALVNELARLLIENKQLRQENEALREEMQ